MAIRFTHHKVIRLAAVLSAATAFFSSALMARMPGTLQHGLGIVLVVAMLVAVMMPMVLYAVILRASTGANRRGQLFDAGLTLAGWLCVWLVVMVAR